MKNTPLFEGTEQGETTTTTPATPEETTQGN
jgi:hypothetical protein